jgi:hypothetical protein
MRLSFRPAVKGANITEDQDPEKSNTKWPAIPAPVIRDAFPVGGGDGY